MTKPACQDSTSAGGPWSIDDIVTTAELENRPSRPPDFEGEAKALGDLAQVMTASPEGVLQRLADAALALCSAASAGVSIAETENGTDIFRWRAVAGDLGRYVGGTMPRNFSPCGTVLERNATQLMADPVRFFPYIRDLGQHISEVLLVPFYRGEKAIGTVWVVSNDPDKQFDAEDARIVTSLARFAGAAVTTLIRAEEAHHVRYERARAEALVAAQKRIFEDLVRGLSLTDLLESLCEAIEQQMPDGAMATVLLADASGKGLLPVSGSRCPPGYVEALGRVPIAPSAGACGTAAFRRAPVVIADLSTDPLAAEFRELAANYGLGACWSVPLLASNGAVLGTYAVYYPSPREPSAQDLDVMEILAQTAVIAVERNRAEEALRESELRYRLVANATNDAIWDWNLVTNEVMWNEGVLSAFGYSENDVDPDASWWVEHIHPEDAEIVSRDIHEHIDHGPDTWRSGYRFRRADGSYATVADTGRIVRDASGKPVRMVGAMEDLTERLRSESALRTAEERFAFVRRSSGVGFWYCDLPFDILEWDERVKEHFWLPANAVVTIDLFYERLHPEDREATRAAIARSIDEHTSYNVTYRTVHPKTGDEKWIRAIGRTFCTEDGTPFRFDGVTLDVTEQKRTEAEIRRQNERLNLVFENVTDYAVIVADTDGVTVDWQGGAERITGFSVGEAVGESAELIFTPEDRAAGVPALEMENAARTGRAEDKRWHLRKDGTRFYANGVMTALRDEAGNLHGFGKVFRDETERKQADEQLAQLLEQERTRADLLAGVADASRRMNAALSVDSIARILSEEARDILGAHISVTSVIGTHEHDRFVHAAALSEKYAAFREVEIGLEGLAAHVCAANRSLRLSETEVELHPEWDGRIADGAVRLPARGWLGAPLVGHGGRNLGVIWTSDKARGDFTAEDEAALQQLAVIASVGIENARLYDSLREQDKRKDEFLATLAHELRNPLAPIRNALTMLGMGKAAEQSTKLLAMMERQLAQLIHLVDDLLDVSRVTSGKITLRRDHVPVSALLDAAVETSRPLIEQGKHRLTVLAPDEPLAIDGDRTRLTQVVTNLLNNAAKYTPDGGRIELAAEKDGDDVVIRVTDSGVGIPREMLPKVFEVFTQVRQSLDRSQGGLGLGLTLVRRLAEMHGGTVTADSAGAGNGSTFTVRLPLTEASPARTASPTEPYVPRPPAGPRRVLVVDDNVDAAESLAQMLRISGHETRTAHSGPLAVDAAIEFRPEVVFLDIGLPGMSGYEVARKLRAESGLSGTVLVALTGWGSEEDHRRSRAAGFDFHLTKPAEADRVRDVLHRLER